MSHILPAATQVLPGMHYQQGRRYNDMLYNSPPPMAGPASHAPLGYHPNHHHQPHPNQAHHNHHHHHHHNHHNNANHHNNHHHNNNHHHHQQPQHHQRPHPYQAYSPYPTYQPPSMPMPQPHYPHMPLVVSSYPHSNQPLPLAYQQLPPPPPPRVASSTTQPPALPSPTGSDRSSKVTTPAATASPASPSVDTPPARARAKFCPPLPWYSVPDEPFPPGARRRRRRRDAPRPSSSALQLPGLRQRQRESTDVASTPSQTPATLTTSETETPLTSHAPSEADSTNPTTPSSSMPLPTLPASNSSTVPATSQPQAKPSPSHASSSSSSRPILPALPLAPAIPLFPEAGLGSSRKRRDVVTPPSPSQESARVQVQTPVRLDSERSSERPTPTLEAPSSESPTGGKGDQAPEKPKVAARSWADLVRTAAPKETTASRRALSAGVALDENPTQGLAASVADILASFGVEGDSVRDQKIAFLEPRGLVNTGNMCYMNSILQVLLCCIPFYSFLDRLSRRSTYSFKDETPLLDALVLFVREFRIIDSTSSEEQMALRLKEAELEQYGEAFIPDFFYEVIRRLPRFASMRRGHQQDAEEFLGFLLEGLHNECVQVMKGADASAAHSSPSASVGGVSSPSSSPSTSTHAEGAWLEVGPKQKPAVTRAVGAITRESPVTKIFGGKLRSELRVPGLKNSVTLEPYQPLQLDIQAHDVNSVTDALKRLTRPETLHGNFHSPRGPNVTATKQVFIESLPPVLILHLKRFQYDNKGGTQKIWKKVGYPLDLEIPKEAFPPHKRAARQLETARYRLIAVVYHHGKNAGGGHYTVDVRRQDGREWIRLDDTVIRRIRKEDVAEAGSEEDPATLAAAAATAALEQHRKGSTGNGNVYDQIAPDWAGTVADEGEGWRQVNGSHGGAGKTNKSGSPNRVNGMHTPSHLRNASSAKQSVRDNRVAYLLFYQRV